MSYVVGLWPVQWSRTHLSEGQTVLVCLVVFQLKVVEGLALWRGLRKRLDDLNKVGGEKAVDSAHLSMVPILIHLASEDDNVTLIELEVPRFLAIVVVQGLGTGQLGYTL